MMKQITMVMMMIMLSSCGQIQRVLDGTEGLPVKIDQTNENSRIIAEGVRKQKISEAIKVLKEEKTRAKLFPLPFDMMPAAKTIANAFNAEEAVSFIKLTLSTLNSGVTAGDMNPPMDEERFQYERVADYYMIMLIAGYLPEATVKTIVENESNQGADQTTMLGILRLRVSFNHDIMLLMATLGLNPGEKSKDGDYAVLNPKSKLDTLGKIENAIKYNEIIEYVCDLDLADQVGVEIADIKVEPLDKELAKKNWYLIAQRAQDDFKATSFSKDPEKNKTDVANYIAKHKSLLEKIQKKLESNPK